MDSRAWVPTPNADVIYSMSYLDLKETRQMVETEQGCPDLSSHSDGLVVNDDGSVDAYFGPTAPEGHESNWVQTVSDEGWFTYFSFMPLHMLFFTNPGPCRVSKN